jgi:hypothetical protein
MLKARLINVPQSLPLVIPLRQITSFTASWLFRCHAVIVRGATATRSNTSRSCEEEYTDRRDHVEVLLVGAESLDAVKAINGRFFRGHDEVFETLPIA